MKLKGQGGKNVSNHFTKNYEMHVLFFKSLGETFFLKTLKTLNSGLTAHGYPTEVISHC